MECVQLLYKIPCFKYNLAEVSYCPCMPHSTVFFCNVVSKTSNVVDVIDSVFCRIVVSVILHFKGSQRSPVPCSIDSAPFTPVERRVLYDF